MTTIRRAFTAGQRFPRPTQHSAAAYLCPRNRFYATSNSDGSNNRNDSYNNSPSDTDLPPSPPSLEQERMTSSNAVIPSPSGSPSTLPEGIPLPSARAFTNAQDDYSSPVDPSAAFSNLARRAASKQPQAGLYNSRNILPDYTVGSSFSAYTAARIIEDNQYHLHIYTHKHNTQMTFSKPNKDSIISLSCGNVGFKKSGRSTFDAAYTLASTVFARIEEKRIQPKSVELVMRGFGPGREACVKALMGREGRYIRPVIERVTDATRLKFGGVRSRGKRRL